MDGRNRLARRGFWPLALLWLPAGVVAQAVLRFGASAGALADSGAAVSALGSLILLVPCGLPLALGCRSLWRLGYRRTAWTAGIGLGALTTVAAVFAGLLGPVAIAAYTTLFSLPVWVARWRLARRR